MNILSVDFILTAFLIFVRVSSLLMTAPFFSGAMIPVRIKLFFSIALTVMLYPIIPLQGAVIATDAHVIQIFVAVLKEVMVGVAMGLVGQIIVSGIQFGGQIISFTTSLGFANIVDPVNRHQSALISQFMLLLGLLFFLAIDGDKMYIKALTQSFEIVPVGTVHAAHAAPVFVDMSVYLFKIGVQLASPFIVVLFLLDLSFAIFARIMPQANIFFIALPVKVGVGILLMLLVIPYLPTTFQQIYDHLWKYLSTLLYAVAP